MTDRPPTSFWRERAWPLLKRAVQFNAVGWIGTLVNSGFLFLFKGVLDIPLIPASVMATELAIIHNFTWHRRWTWRHREVTRNTPFLKHLVQYNAATGAVDLTIHVTVLWLLSTFAGVHYLLANLVGMIIGPFIKFWLNELLIFRRRNSETSHESEAMTTDSTNGTSNGHSTEPRNRNRQPRRANKASLAKVEKVVLEWMAERLPRWITPDGLTVVGLLAAAIIAVGYLLTHLHMGWIWLASAGIVLNWWGDSLDGTVARVRKIERPKYGFFVDHYSDALSTVVICAGMGLSPIMALPIALTLIIGYLLLMILSYLTSLARGVFKISMGGVGPTEIRLGMIAVNTAVFFLGNPVLTIGGVSMTLFTLAGVLVTVGFGLFFLGFGEKERRKLNRIDRPKKPGAALARNGHGASAEPRSDKAEEGPLRKVG